jgi:hypothetical protein
MAMVGMFVANFWFIFLKAFQQRNVAFDHYFWVVPTSFAMAASEVYIVFTVAQVGFHWHTVLPLGLAGGVGSLCAMLIHKKYFRKRP